MTQQWTLAAEKQQLPVDLFIDGEFQKARSGATFENRSPIDGRLLGNVAAAAAEDVDAAVRSGLRAFESGSWRWKAPAERKKILLRLAELIRENNEEIALAETLDVGKPIGDTLSVDGLTAADCFQWYAEAIDKVYGEVAPTAPDRLALISREPLGVVGAVVPWNYPTIISSWKVAPALASGNSVVLKPAEQSPSTGLILARLALEAGVPPGVFNVVTGGPAAGEALGRHHDIAKIGFTGSGPVGRKFLQYAGESNGKQIAVEAGGKSPQLILDDVTDLDAAVAAVAWGIFYNAGQTCHAGSRVLVGRGIHDEFLDRLIAFTQETFVPADPLNPATTLGAIVSAEQAEQVMKYIQIGSESGADLVLGGERAREDTGGTFIKPTIFTNVETSSTIAQEEIFGPVLTVTPVTGLEDGISQANQTGYGLAAAVWTADLPSAHQAAQRLRAGTVWVNTYDEASIMTPFGGFGASGFGRDRSLHALASYTALKTTWINIT